MTNFDVVIIGAGPAGMACAVALAKYTIKIAIVDENTDLGGQIYRNVDSPAVDADTILGTDYTYGQRLTQAVKNAKNIVYYNSATVWNIEHNTHHNTQAKTVYCTQKNVTIALCTKKVVLATGAIERPMPFAGWTKAGVMTIGGAQSLLKTSGVVAENAVFVGSGPLLWVLSSQYIKAGVPIKAIIDTTPTYNYIRAVRHLYDALRGYKLVCKGLRLVWQVRQATIPIISNVQDICVTGDQITDGVEYTKNGKKQHIKTDTVCIHQGVVPNINMARAMGCKITWDMLGQCWSVVIDKNYKTSVQGVYAVGDGVTIGGAKVAEYSGGMVAYCVLQSLGICTAKKSYSIHKKQRKSALYARTFLNVLYTPNPVYMIPKGNTIVCRCEEKTADEVCKAIALGCQGPNQLKTFNRCGMGPCQGRYCGGTITQMMAHYTHMSPEQVGYYRLRPPFKPVTVAQMAHIKLGENT